MCARRDIMTALPYMVISFCLILHVIWPNQRCSFFDCLFFFLSRGFYRHTLRCYLMVRTHKKQLRHFLLQSESPMASSIRPKVSSVHNLMRSKTVFTTIFRNKNILPIKYILNDANISQHPLFNASIHVCVCMLVIANVFWSLSEREKKSSEHSVSNRIIAAKVSFLIIHVFFSLHIQQLHERKVICMWLLLLSVATLCCLQFSFSFR